MVNFSTRGHRLKKGKFWNLKRKKKSSTTNEPQIFEFVLRFLTTEQRRTRFLIFYTGSEYRL